MSTDYYISGKIPKKKILSNTDINIVKDPQNNEFLQDKYGNYLRIYPQMVIENDESTAYEDNENIRELGRYGGNNALYIIDTLVREFNMIYFSDDGFQNLYRPAEESHDPDLISNIKKDMMYTHGYKFISKDCIIIPERSENDYKKETD
jgi:general stress protein YciG